MAGSAQGYLFIFLVALDWVGASYLVAGLENHHVPPFLITTICNSMFLLFLLPLALDFGVRLLVPAQP